MVSLVVNRDRHPEVNFADRGHSTIAVLGGFALFRNAWLDSGYMLFVSLLRPDSFFSHTPRDSELGSCLQCTDDDDSVALDGSRGYLDITSTSPSYLAVTWLTVCAVA